VRRLATHSSARLQRSHRFLASGTVRQGKRGRRRESPPAPRCGLAPPAPGNGAGAVQRRTVGRLVTVGSSSARCVSRVTLRNRGWLEDFSQFARHQRVAGLPLAYPTMRRVARRSAAETAPGRASRKVHAPGGRAARVNRGRETVVVHPEPGAAFPAFPGARRSKRLWGRQSGARSKRKQAVPTSSSGTSPS
jgi:hypothetical protein